MPLTIIHGEIIQFMKILEKTEVLNIIPQKPVRDIPSRIARFSRVASISKLTLNKQNIFCKNGFFQEPGLIENIAQTAALRAGYIANQNNLDPSIGFIGAAKRLKIFELPKYTDVIHTKITVLNQLMNASIIKGEVYVGSKTMAEGEMTIFIKE